MDILDELRNREYTGENRCIPCTVANVAIAAVLASLIATWSVAVGIGAFLLFLLAIYLKGYLVPGTPTLTKRYFPDRVLRLFDKAPASEKPVATEAELDLERILQEADALEPCAHGQDLCLTQAFESAWFDRIADLEAADTTRTDLARILDMDEADLTVAEYGDAFVARLDGRRIGQWESRAAFLADMAAANELRERYSPWTGYEVQQRSRLLQGLRIFLEECPSCGGPVTLEEDVVESCCRSIDVIAATCGDCGARLFEAEQSML